MMDIEKLIAAVKLCGSTPRVDQCKQCAYWDGGDMSKCIPKMTDEAVAALSTLQVENGKLREALARVWLEREAYRRYVQGLPSNPGCNTCENRGCGYRPRIGETVRKNCPLYRGPEKED